MKRTNWTARQVISIMVLGLLFSIQANAADHLEAPGVMGRGQLDLNDLYAFQAPGNANNSVLILTVNPFLGTTSPTTFGTAATGVAYEFNIDTTGNAIPDVTYRTTFTGTGPAQAFSVTRNGTQVAAGNTGSIAAVAGGGMVTAGVFDDPFFFDPGVLGPGGATGTDAFAGANVSAIVLELPSVALGSMTVGIQARTLENGLQVDRVGRPAIATVLIPSAQRDQFNQALAANDVGEFTDEVVASITGLGNGANAAGLASILLPDLLTFDAANPAGFLNGRGLADDVIDAELGILTNGVITTDLVNANDVAFSGVFPFLAPMQAAAVPEPASTALFACGGLGLAMVRRWRRRGKAAVA